MSRGPHIRSLGIIAAAMLIDAGDTVKRSHALTIPPVPFGPIGHCPGFGTIRPPHGLASRSGHRHTPAAGDFHAQATWTVAARRATRAAWT